MALVGLKCISDILMNESSGGDSSSSNTSNKKSRNAPPAPAPEAKGAPHSIIEKPGREGQYTTHFGDGSWKQYRGTGRPHGAIDRPNIKETVVNENKITGKKYIGDTVRPPRVSEIPK
ncbi:polymorphic toxin type 24 domain-containing protein [Silvanigrella paludirubra]|nr:polymorphic toxin type 24 domain-containing protein [Silvanigrella paludirubra]